MSTSDAEKLPRVMDLSTNMKQPICDFLLVCPSVGQLPLNHVLIHNQKNS